MLSLCERWLQAPQLRVHFGAHDLGIAIRARLREVYQQLAELQAPHLGFELRQLEHAVGKTPSELKAIAIRLHHSLKARAVQAADTEAGARFRELHGVLFPDGLTSLSQRMSGSAELDHGLSHNFVTRLQSVPVTNHTLAEAYRVWAIVEETTEKRRYARTRTHPLLDIGSRLYKSTKRAREQWQRTTRALFTAIALLPLTEQTREDLLSFLDTSIVDIATQQCNSMLTVAPDQHTLPDFQRPDFAGEGHADYDEGEDDTLDFDPSDIDVPDDLFVTH